MRNLGLTTFYASDSLARHFYSGSNFLKHIVCSGSFHLAIRGEGNSVTQHRWTYILHILGCYKTTASQNSQGFGCIKQGDTGSGRSSQIQSLMLSGSSSNLSDIL